MKITETRKALGLSVSDLAAMFCLHKETVVRYERYERDPTKKSSRVPDPVCFAILKIAINVGVKSEPLYTSVERLTGAQLSEKLSILGMNQERFAEEIGHAPSTVSNWINDVYLTSAQASKFVFLRECYPGK